MEQQVLAAEKWLILGLDTGSMGSSRKVTPKPMKIPHIGWESRRVRQSIGLTLI